MWYKKKVKQKDTEFDVKLSVNDKRLAFFVLLDILNCLNEAFLKDKHSIHVGF